MYLSRLCELFPGRFPTEVLEESDRLPAGLLEQIGEARAYEQAFFMVQRDPRVQEPELVQTVKAIEFQLAREEGEQDGWLPNRS